MKSRRKIVIAILALIAALGISAFVFAPGGGPREAYYKGKSASYWLDHVSYDDNGVPKEDEALLAFREMGTNAFPVLLDAFQDFKEDPPAVAWLRQRLCSGPFPARLAVLLPDERDMSENATDVLIKVYGEYHCRELLQWLNDTNMGREDIVLPGVVNHVGPDNREQVPLFVSFLDRSQDGYSTDERALALICLGRIGPGASNAIPAITNACQSTDNEVQTAAAWALWKVTGRTNMALPLLQAALAEGVHGGFMYSCNVSFDSLQNRIKNGVFMSVLFDSLTNSDDAIRMSACDELCSCAAEGYSSDAKEAVPALLKAIHDPCPGVRDHAWPALRAFDPETAAKTAGRDSVEP